MPSLLLEVKGSVTPELEPGEEGVVLPRQPPQRPVLEGVDLGGLGGRAGEQRDRAVRAEGEARDRAPARGQLLDRSAAERGPVRRRIPGRPPRGRSGSCRRRDQSRGPETGRSSAAVRTSAAPPADGHHREPALGCRPSTSARRRRGRRSTARRGSRRAGRRPGPGRWSERLASAPGLASTTKTLVSGTRSGSGPGC